MDYLPESTNLNISQGATLNTVAHWVSKDYVDIVSRINWLLEYRPKLITEISTSTPLTVSETSDLVVCNSAVAMVVNLPEAAGSGRRLYVKNINTGVVTVTPSGTDTIDGSATQAIYQYECVLICDYYSGLWVIL